jgi:hypothetical protein
VDIVNYSLSAQSVDIENMLTPEGCVEARKGLEGFSHGAAGAGARERGAPESPVFCGAKNAPKFLKFL